jgi:hypothetical protein
LAITFDGTQSTIAAYLLDPESMTSRQLPYGTNTVSYGLMPEVALLRDGRVLIVDENLAGTDLPGPASVFDPNQEVFTSIGTPNTPRSHAAIATLADGKVLLAGGLSSGPATIYNRSDEGLTDAELYDPATGTFTLVGELPSVQGMAQGFLRKDGRVLIVQQGDSTTRFGDAAMTSLALDIFDPATGTFTALEPVHLPGPPTVTHLADGRLLFTGRHQGLDGVDDEPLAAIYDPANGSTIEQQAPRAVLPEGVVTADGRVVLVGGFTNPPLTPGDPAVPWIEIGQ